MSEGPVTPPKLPEGGRRSRWPWLLLAVVLLLAIVNIGRDDRPTGVVNTPSPEPEVCQKRIVYFVEGTASAVDITIENADGNTEQASNRAVPLRGSSGEGLRIGRIPCGEFVYISAQNQGETGSVTCRIEADGVEVGRATSEGAFVIATCSGVVPSD